MNEVGSGPTFQNNVSYHTSNMYGDAIARGVNVYTVKPFGSL